MSERNIVCTVQYDGTAYSGFQLQGDLPTIQRELERAFSSFAGHQVRILGAGRTDAGVHARGQVVAFRLRGSIPTSSIPEAANALLPPDIAIWSAAEAEKEFHPRYCAKSKVYTYTVWRGRRRSPFWRNYAYHYPHQLEISAMREAASFLEGKHDFVAFRSSGGSAKTTVRTVYRLEILEKDPLLQFVAEADGFLYNMVRILAGTLLEVGRGALSPEDVQAAVAGGDRNCAGPTAPPHGLCLEQVLYP